MYAKGNGFGTAGDEDNFADMMVTLHGSDDSPPLSSTPIVESPASPASLTIIRIQNYLDSEAETLQKGHFCYYGRACLELALKAYQRGDRGIGAVLIHVDDQQIIEFRDSNLMGTRGFWSDHAETRVISRFQRWYLNREGMNFEVDSSEIRPFDQYERTLNEFTSLIPNGSYLITSVEPCIMCMSASVNSFLRVMYICEDPGGSTVRYQALSSLPRDWVANASNRRVTFERLLPCDDLLATLSEDLFRLGYLDPQRSKYPLREIFSEWPR